jgi:hypothetical protein
VLRLALAFFDIALHRRGPEELPASTFLLLVVIAIDLFISAVALQMQPPLEYGPVLIALDTAVRCAFIWGVLKAFNHERRFRQAATALVGTDALISLLSLPLLVGNMSAAEGSGGNPAAVLILVLFLWQIDVSGYVLSRAIARPYFVGVAIMLGYVLFAISLRASVTSAA